VSGVDLVTVSKLLGHSSVQMTMRYAHPKPENFKLAVKALERFKRLRDNMRKREKSHSRKSETLMRGIFTGARTGIFGLAERKRATEARLEQDYADMEIDRRNFNGHVLVLLEDRHKGMLKPDGTSEQYISAIESVSEKGHAFTHHRRYVTDLMRKLGYRDAKHGAMAIFANPQRFKSVLGEAWHGFTVKKQAEKALKAEAWYRK
jgi:hypothetical protein